MVKRLSKLESLFFLMEEELVNRSKQLMFCIS